MIYTRIPQPVPFYNEAAHRTTGRENCRGQLIDGVVFPNTHVPAFIIERDPSANDSFEVSVTRKDNMLSANQGAGDMTVVNYEGRDYIFSPAFAMGTPMAPGEYYLRFFDGSNTYYSEIFRLSDCTETMTKVEYSDTCVKARIPWQLAPEGFILDWFSDTRLGPSVVTTDEEVEDDGEEQRVTSVRTTVQTTLAEVMPDHMLQVLHALKHHTNVVITDAGLVHDDIKLGTISATPVAGGCKQLMSLQLSFVHEWREGCCDGSGSAEECEADSAQDAVFGVQYRDEAWFTANSSSGDLGLKLNDISGYGKVYENGGFTYFAELGEYYMCAMMDDMLSEDVLFYITGTEVNEPTANLVNPEIVVNMTTGGAICAVQSFITGRFAQIYYSKDGGMNWTSAWIGTEEDLSSGVSGIYRTVADGESIIYRVRYYKHGCEYGFSPVFVGALIVTSGAFNGTIKYSGASEGFPYYSINSGTGINECNLLYASDKWGMYFNNAYYYEVVQAVLPLMIDEDWYIPSGWETTPLPLPTLSL